MYLVTNAQLLVDTFSDHFAASEVQTISNSTIQSIASLQAQDTEKEALIANLLEQYGETITLEKQIAPSMDQLLQEQLDSYEFSFNLLPPTNRLVIPAINMDVPLVRTEVKDYAEFDAGMFDKELENGVVKYPTTPDPGQGGNTFFFGHTSQEYWKKNPYGTVFRNIPKLKQDDLIQVVREGELHEYRVVKTVIVKPKQVNDSYLEYVDIGKEYITLMGCYPIGKISERMMIFAEKVN